MDGTILLADDDRTIRTVLTQALTRAGCRVHATSSLRTLLRWVEEGRGDLVVCDVIMPDGDGLEMLPHIHEHRPTLPVIVISAQNSIMTAIRASEAKAHDYLPKPFDLPDLMSKVRAALGGALSAGAAPACAPTGPPPSVPSGAEEQGPLLGSSVQMQKVFRDIARVRNMDAPLMLLGEAGVGKSLVAKVLHETSRRADQPMVQVLPFHPPQPERWAQAGTLVIEDPHALPPALQQALVYMLDATPAGNPRVITCATGENPGEMRADLYYRLCGLILHLPPLRSHPEDLGGLARHFLREAGDERTVSEEARAALWAHGWPGNVRELRNCMMRVAQAAPAEAGQAAITGTDIKNALTPQAPRDTAPHEATAPQAPHPDTSRLSETISAHLTRYFEMHGNELPPPGLHARLLREIEAPLIEITLNATGGNQIRCAEILGINRNTLRKKISDLDISVTRRRKLM